MFAVNIAGVLADAQIIDQTTYSWEWDENWEAKTARTKTGWSAEIRIPLRVLRFDSKLPVQSWGFQASRFIAQREETDLWAYVPRDVAAPIAFFGRLDGLADLKGAGALELQPFVLGYGRRRDASQMAVGSGTTGSASAGLDLKWHIAQDLTFDAALNPDFSQVELDQIILNLSTYETFLPEKRPFFLEGIDAFSFPMQVFYSRRIGSAPLPPSLRNDASSSEELVDFPGAGDDLRRRKAGRPPHPQLDDWRAQRAYRRQQGLDLRRDHQQDHRAAGWRRTPRSTSCASNASSAAVATSASSAPARRPTRATAAIPRSSRAASASSVRRAQRRSSGSNCFHDAYVGGIDGLLRSPSGAYVVNGAFIESYIHGGPIVEQPDGTLIGSGATAPAGWLRVAKEGGKHLTWSAEYTGAGRQLNYNDLGYMQRQNVETAAASVGWRTLDPGKHTVDTTSTFLAGDSRNNAWLDLGQTYELNTRLHLLDFSSVFLAADYAPARFDDREVGDGTALERAGYLGGKLEYDSDPRRAVYATIANQTQVMGAGIYATSVQASAVFHALPQLDIELLPQLTWAAGEYRYAWQSVGAYDPYLFGKLAAKNISVTVRASYAFTPRLTLQAYAQAFLASGHFSDLRAVGMMPFEPGAPPRQPGGIVHLSELAAAPPFTPGIINPDFEEAAINASVVFRWEYRLGSTLYLVYTRSQIPEVQNLIGPAMLAPREFDHGATTDEVLLKLSYWWAS